VVAPSVDLLALLRPDQVGVTIAGHRFLLTATCASHWLGAIATDTQGLGGIVPGLVADDDLELMLDLASAHPDIESRWSAAARTALGRGAGRDWWWAWNLSKKALGAWIYVNGILLRQNVNAKSLSYPDWLDACYTMLWQGGDEQQQMKLDMELAMRPKGIAVATSAQATRRMLADFAAD
jgi:hypothetical protein